MLFHSRQCHGIFYVLFDVTTLSSDPFSSVNLIFHVLLVQSDQVSLHLLQLIFLSCIMLFIGLLVVLAMFQQSLSHLILELL